VDHLLRHRLMDRLNDMDLMMLVHLYVVDSLIHLHLLVVVHLDVLQNLDEQNLDVHLPYLDVVRLLLVVVVVVVELRHQLRMDYFLDVVDVELRCQLRMDYFLDVVQEAELERPLLVQLVLQLLLPPRTSPLLVQPFQHREML
jgi:hypothetical protein